MDRIREQHDVPAEAEVEDTVDVLYAITSFETYEYLAIGVAARRR